MTEGNQKKYEAAISPQGVFYSELDHFVNVDGFHLYKKICKPSCTARALLLILHGYGDHCERFNELATAFAERGILSFGHDQFGHGRSEGKRAEISDLGIYVRDSLQHVDMMKKEYPDLPLFAFGHSMGGALVLLCGLERPGLFAGTISSAPALHYSGSSITVFLAKMMAWIMPSLVVSSASAEQLTRDPKEVELYKADPLIFQSGFKAGFAVQMLRGMQQVKEGMDRICWPLLVLHGTADCVTEITGSRMLAQQAASTNKTLKEYPGCYHSLLKEVKEDREVIFQDILTWVENNLPA